MVTKKITEEIGINEENKTRIVDILTRLLANEFVLYTKTWKYHWNVEGPRFREIHLFLEEQYNDLVEIIDNLAERCRKLGHYAVGSLKQYLDLSDLLEKDDLGTPANTMLTELCQDHETIIRLMREAIGTVGDKYRDVGTADLITTLMEKHETMAWMLRASSKV